MSQLRNNNDGEPDGEPAVTTRDFASFEPTLAASAAPSGPSSATISHPAAASDSALPLPRPAHHPRVHYNLSLDTSVSADDAHRRHGPEASGFARSATGATRPEGLSPILRRRNTRAATFRTVEEFDSFEGRAGWHPGAEPGVDPEKPDGGHASMPTLQVPCEITVFDFSQEDMVMHHLDNATLPQFLQLPQPRWVKCRWISVSGLSWDVIQALGQHKKLHKLAIEDIMNTRNRTKADWYSNHAFFVLTLQKLVRLNKHDDSSDESDSELDDAAAANAAADGSDNHSFQSVNNKGGMFRNVRRWWRRLRARRGWNGAAGAAGGSPTAALDGGELGYSGAKAAAAQGGARFAPDLADESQRPQALRTLQRYHAAANDARTEFMEKFSVLSENRLVVTAEQVSIFITNDNTIISFIEQSSEDVEGPILTRLSTPDTILRQSCDASMVVQAIMDAIIDLAIPLTACYSDVIGDLELDVLTRPNLSHTKKLYITITEMNQMLSTLTPIIGLVNSLRDHKTDMPQDVAAQELQNPLKGVVITPMTHTYLGDVLDHCVLITDSLQQLRSQAEGMIDLIFNTITAYQNESLKQLTLMTIIFLPLTFLTGYFGQNFQPFDVINYDVQYFWKIAIPVVVATILILMREIIWESITSLMQQRDVLRMRRHKRKRRKLADARAKVAKVA